MRINLRSRFEKSYSFRKHAIIFLLLLLVSVSPVTAFDPTSAETTQESTKKLLKRAKKLLRKGRLADSATTIRLALAADPASDAATLELSYVYLKQRKLFKSHELAFAVAKRDPDNSYAFAILGSLQLASGNFREARALLTNAIALNRREALAWASLGLLDFYENRVEESVLNLKEAVFHERREPDFEYALAQVSSRVELYREAAEAYERFLRIAPKNDTERRNRIKGLVTFLRFLGKRSGIYTLAGESKTSVSARIVNNRPVIPIRLKKGGEVLNFVLDTGSGITVISESTSKRLNIKPVAKGGVARALGGTGKFKIVYGFLDSIRIGEVRVRNVPVYIRKFQDNGVKIDGYIGLSLISKYITTLDYQNGVLSLEKREDWADASPPLDALTVPLRMTSSGFLSGNVKLPGVESDLHFILDTGASISVVSNALASADQVRPHLMERTIRVIGAAGVTDDVPMYMLRDLDFGGILTPELTAVALDLGIINETSGFAQAGILGGNFLRDYKLTFDFKRSRVTLVPN